MRRSNQLSYEATDVEATDIGNWTLWFWAIVSVVQQQGADLELFSSFRRAIKNRGFNQIQKFFRRISLNGKWIHLSEKKFLGLGAL